MGIPANLIDLARIRRIITLAEDNLDKSEVDIYYSKGYTAIRVTIKETDLGDILSVPLQDLMITPETRQ